MSGSHLARKVIRLRSIRSRRFLHNYDHPPTPTIPYLSHLSPNSDPTRTFPLYQPPPPREYIPLTKETLAQLPSDESLNRQLKNRLTQKAIEGLPDLTEEDLKDFYADLVKTGVQDGMDGRLGIEGPEQQLKLPLDRREREDVLNTLEERLLGFGGSSQSAIEGGLVKVDGELRNAPKHYKIFAALAQLGSPEDSGPSGTSKSPAGVQRAVDIPLGLVSRREWNVLFEEFVQRGDARGAEALVDVMTLHGVPIDESKIDRIIQLHAAAGRVDEVGRLTAEMVNSGLAISDSHKDLFILSLLRHTPSHPQNAISQLTSAEQAGQPYPQSSYQVVLQHLTQPSRIFQPNSHTRALAWDLFANMRLSAHPTPTRELYTTMIRTCGDSAQPEPERARDLWIEMTENEKIQPTREEYSAIIRALGSTKKDYLEAFDLLRQMLAKHHDAIYTPFASEEEGLPKFSQYVPILETFTGLLEGTKRAGDLNRARWILTETVKLARTGKMLNSSEWKDGIDADLLSGVFMTYASWKPLVRRGAVKVKEDVNMKEEHAIEQDENNGSDVEAGQPLEKNTQQEEEWLDVNVMEELVESSRPRSEAIEDPSSSRPDLPLTPQSSADALREATALFRRILDDIASPSSPDVYLPFKDVKLGAKLINSYISVHMVHSPSLAATKNAYDEAWKAVSEFTKGSVKPNGWSYLQILEKCNHGTRGGMVDSDRSVASEWGKAVWEEYLVWSDKAQREIDSIPEQSMRERRRWLVGLGDRQIERTWKSSIRLFAMYDTPSRSLSILDKFHALYPPEDIIKTYRPLPETNLKIKLITPNSTPEANVPPYLLFDDIKILHEKLIKADDVRGIGKLMFLTKRYEGMLYKRRKWRLRGIGQVRERNRGKFAERERRRLEKGGVRGIAGGVNIDEVD
ncbi:hypothetical protein I302_102890 [Kwoniella bestiolae CBS 10118]|uniref:Pentatricopeptide repeat domain-containing protein n=1 Tax=Kwoniella bestiolae CBS 10118 TaxID=1296100 RepID=A0A1B9GGA8_9TREE|nr:hypothetical protein I302_01585 [Kwoniella bestiolae CBS 10118]OCF30066.1 hypothetical protein I302_01585 [Kwoniella bestiolae CBS 10118]